MRPHAPVLRPRTDSGSLRVPEGSRTHVVVDAGRPWDGTRAARIAAVSPTPRLAPIVVLVLYVLANGVALAQESASGAADPWAGVEEMVVSGSAAGLLKDLATADSVIGFDSEDLVAIGATDVGDLAAFTPNLEIVTAGASTPTFFIRGVGLNDFNPNSTGAVAIYIDDAAINAPALQLPELFDVEAVNVLRGPQGTGLARNASAGAIKIYGRKPTGELGGYISADFGNYHYMQYEGALDTSVVPELIATRFAFRLRKREGVMNNNCGRAPPVGQRLTRPIFGSNAVGPWSICGEPVDPGAVSDIPVGLARNVNDDDSWGLRGTFSFDPIDGVSFLFNGHGSRRDELTQLGQSIGTSGNFCVGGDICSAPFAGVPPSERGVPSGGILGGPQGAGSTINNGYIPIEIRNALTAAAPCVTAVNPIDGCARQSLAVRAAANQARIAVARDLAENLDYDPWSGDFNNTGRTTLDKFGFFLHGDFELTDMIRAKTVTAYDQYRRRRDQDLDFSPETLFEIITRDNAWQFYQDLKVEGDLDIELPISWEVGGYFLTESLDVDVFNDFGTTAAQSVAVLERDYVQRTDSAGGHFYVAIDLLEELTLDGGFRWNWEQKTFYMKTVSNIQLGEPNFDLREEWDSPTGTVRLTYRFTESISSFFKYTRGWKPGSFNATASVFSGVTVARPEVIDSFEWGIAAAWFEDMVTFNGQLFFYGYEDYQIFTAQQFLGGTPEFVILNAKNAEVLGAEIETTIRPWEGFSFDGRFSWLETQFLDFVRVDQFLTNNNTGSPVTLRASQNAGNPLLNSPRFKVSLTAQQTVTIGQLGSLTLRWDGVWTDTTYYDPTQGVGLGNDEGNTFLPDDTIAQSPYWLHNLRLTWLSQEERIEVAAWVRNLENTSYKTFAFDGSSFQATTIYFVGDPRTYGITMKLTF